MTRVDLLTPAGRLVSGSLYKPRTTDAEGRPLVYKSGANAGQPRNDYSFGLAIAKTAGHTHWAQTEWGAKIYAVGQAAFPQQSQSPQFAWKIDDGDSTVPNLKGRKNVDREGWPGHWVLWFSGSYAPRCFRDNGTVPMPDADAINLGDYVQVFGNVEQNGSTQKPGVYLNHSMVNFLGYGKRIVVGPDATAVGFGQGVQLPPGASATPIATMTTAAAAGVALPGPQLPVPQLPVPQLPVAPNPAFLQPPLAPVAAPPAAPARRMTAKAGGATYEQLTAAGWNDTLLVQHGYMEV